MREGDLSLGRWYLTGALKDNRKRSGTEWSLLGEPCKGRQEFGVGNAQEFREWWGV